MQIAIFCQQLEFMGGIERVVLEQLRIFKAHGADVILLIDRQIDLMKDRVNVPVYVLKCLEEGRKEQLETILKAEKPDLLIFHGVGHQGTASDIAVANSCGVANVCVIHFPFNSNVALDGSGNSWKAFREGGRDCTAYATVSAIDAMWWRGLGCRAFHVQNPFVHPQMNAEPSRRSREAGTTNLLWVGRQAEPKQPKPALAAFARAYSACPELRLTMVGGSDKGWRALRKEAKRLGCASAVRFLSERPDLNEEWMRADIHLLTSVCESFCLVWAEAKAAGIPTVMFEMPYLELAEDPRGYVAVEQRNIEALSDAIVSLAKDRERRLELGREARESLARFNDEAVWSSWMRLVDGLKTGCGREVLPEVRHIASQMYFAYSYRKEKHQWEEDMEHDFNLLTHCSLRPFAKLLAKLVGGIRAIKRKIRG